MGNKFSRYCFKDTSFFDVSLFIIYFIGYDIGNEYEQVDQNNNPSIIEIKIEDLFNYGI